LSNDLFDVFTFVLYKLTSASGSIFPHHFYTQSGTIWRRFFVFIAVLGHIGYFYAEKVANGKIAD